MSGGCLLFWFVGFMCVFSFDVFVVVPLALGIAAKVLTCFISSHNFWLSFWSLLLVLEGLGEVGALWAPPHLCIPLFSSFVFLCLKVSLDVFQLVRVGSRLVSRLL